jgi:Uma2 family endonuclease
MITAYSNFSGPPEIGTISLPISRLSTDQFLQIIETGIFESSEKKVELIEGVITEMSPPGPEHESSLLQLITLFAPVVSRFYLAIQGTLVLPEGNLYLPDLALLRRKPEGYRHAHAGPEDVVLVLESSATSLPKDRFLKLPVYAAAGIQEYWIVDLERETLLVYRDPHGGAYRSEQTLVGEQTVSPLACSDLTIRVADIFQ